MKDVLIITGVSLRKREGRKSTTPLLQLIIGLLNNATRGLRNHSLQVGVIAVVISFLGILLDFEIFSSIMAMVSLLALRMSEKGGRK